MLASALGGATAAADTRAVGCGTSRVGEITVATLRNAPIVTLVANGAPVTLLLDTGAEWTILTPAAAKRVGAQTPRIVFDRQIRGLSGSLATNEVELRSFTAGDVAIPWRRVRVASLNMPSVFSGPLDGVLGADTLSSFDVDLDLPHHRMVFYGKQSCPSAAPAWAEPYATIPARKTFSNHLSFPAQLDGRQIDTFIDTGAQLSVLSSKAALALGVTERGLVARPRHSNARCRGGAAELAPSPFFTHGSRGRGRPQSRADRRGCQPERRRPRSRDRFPRLAADLAVLRIAADFPVAPDLGRLAPL